MTAETAGAATVAASQVICSIQELESYREKLRLRKKRDRRFVNVCLGTGCAAKGSRRLYQLFCEAAEQAR
jgi:NADH:ubiquinone oxidoreductase subunit E